MNTTLNIIRKHSPCQGSWKTLLEGLAKTAPDDEPLSLRSIYKICGFDDALWALRAMPKDSDNSIRILVCDLVEPAMKFTKDPRPPKALEVARAFANGEAENDELDAAWAAARDAARDAAGAAARDSARDAAGAAAGAAAWAAARAAARAAAWAAARDAAGAAARDSARDAAGAAAWAAQEEVFKAWLDLNEEGQCHTNES